MPFNPKRNYKASNSMSKKKALSNKALTKKVRTIQKGIGSYYQSVTTLLYNAVTLTAGAEDVNYLTMTETDSKYLYIDFIIKLLCSTAGGATVRLLFAIDNLEADTDLTACIGSNSVNNYDQGAIEVSQYRRYKRRKFTPQAIIYKDFTIGLNNGEPKIFKYRMPLHGKRLNPGGNQWQVFVSALSDEADSLVSISAMQVYLDMSP